MTSPAATNGSKTLPAASDDVLVLDCINAGYGTADVLRDISIAVPRGTPVALLGANGAGKTTLLRVASGLLRPTSGTVWLAGREITDQAPWRRARAGLCLVPEGRGIFPSLTVRENLELQVLPGSESAELGRAIEVFPALGSRMGQVSGSMSGGEQQMLALARAVLAEPRVILLDEISMGLAPVVVDKLFDSLARLAATGTAMLLVEQYIERALDMCPLACVINKGQILYNGTSESLKRETLIESYLGG